MSANLTMVSDLREWPEIRQSLYATHLCGLVAYCQLGIITHRFRAKWDGQSIILPLVFVFFPLLYICQILVAIPLALRNLLWRPREGLKYYICAVLGIYTVRTSFVDEDGMVDDTSKAKGLALLLDQFTPRAIPLDRKWSDGRIFSFIVTLAPLYQCTSTSLLYIRRCTMQGAKLLDVDHRIGLMAIGASLALLGYYFFEVTGYDWQDTLCTPTTSGGIKLLDYPLGTLHKFDQGLGGDVSLIESIDVTNKHVYDCVLAACVHLIHLRFSGRCFPLFEHRNSNSHSIATATILPSAVALVASVPLIVRSFWASPARQVVWKGDKLVRLLILLALSYIATATINSEVREVKQVVGQHVTTSWNQDWMWKDPWADFLWPV
ncbi:hypothetical protein BU16DRAFT_539421 [Lophium mytilinum]|uniref:Uncharacterized protein n=1 Tax=Lophium mytilinum TaxID=390894 RepID=A0A6A6QTF8_9PEZI|nr:hypothetical protein BU16DRAFT_539421 [Lophium mytilinum]